MFLHPNLLSSGIRGARRLIPPILVIRLLDQLCKRAAVSHCLRFDGNPNVVSVSGKELWCNGII